MNKNDSIINDNLGLVHACCKRFVGRGIEYEELYSAGCEGLVKAVKRFDQSRNLQLSTYAVPVIMGEIRQLFRDAGTVKVSRGLKDLALKIARVNEEYAKKTGRELTVSELSQILCEPNEKISEALCCMQTPVSLTSGYDENEEAELDIPVDSQEEKIAERLSLCQVIGELCDNDKMIIELRYYKQKTQSQTAQQLGMTQVQISRREKKILQQLREKLS